MFKYYHEVVPRVDQLGFIENFLINIHFIKLPEGGLSLIKPNVTISQYLVILLTKFKPAAVVINCCHRKPYWKSHPHSYWQSKDNYSNCMMKQFWQLFILKSALENSSLCSAFCVWEQLSTWILMFMFLLNGLFLKLLNKCMKCIKYLKIIITIEV